MHEVRLQKALFQLAITVEDNVMRCVLRHFIASSFVRCFFASVQRNPGRSLQAGLLAMAITCFAPGALHAQQGCTPDEVEVSRTVGPKSTKIVCKNRVQHASCVGAAGKQLRSGMGTCQGPALQCLYDADIESNVATCAAGLFFNSAITAATAVTSPPAAPVVTYLTFGAAMTSCGIEIRAAEKAMIRCTRPLDDCRAAKLNEHKTKLDDCKK